jgi:hypothetical protein
VTFKDQLQSSACLSALTAGNADEPQATAPSTPHFVDEHAIERVLGVPVRTLRNWRVSGRGPPFNKFGSSVRYELESTLAWARRRQVSSTSEVV